MGSRCVPFLLWALVLVHVCSSVAALVGDGTCQNGFLLKGEETLEQQFIVRFHEYKEANDWRREMERAMDGASYQWKWMERRNPASSFPTDFGVITLGERTADMAKKRMLSTSFVKDIHPDRVIHRDLAMEDDFGPPGGVPQEGKVWKPPGRLRTRSTFGLDNEDDDYMYGAARVGDELRRRLSFGRSHSVTGMLHAGEIWKLGYSGKNVRVGVFDTGIRGDHPHVKHIKERTNWTHQQTLSDGLGHGSFVAGVIAGKDQECPGFAPEVDLYTFKVFTDDQVSYTSWFLDAFNYAIIMKMHIVNLSIGGPDYLDHPFVDKVLEVTASGIIMLSAIGNDGPLYGTLNNPADQSDVIGIGGIDYDDHIARFSSRGMSTWELPLGYGRIKPDVLAYAQDVSGSRMQSGCRRLSGTSVASPVAAGAVALLASTVPEAKRWKILNPASMKQALVEGAARLKNERVYVQGAGKIHLRNSMEILQNYKPRASLVPGTLNLTDCPYMWPFCTQPLYANAAPTIINGTILNGMSVTGVLGEAPVFVPLDDGGRLISMDFEYSDVLWPWSGYLAMYIRVRPEGKAFSGTASGKIRFSIVSPPEKGETQKRTSSVEVPFSAKIIPTPPRKKRILWDQFHSVKYPPAYFPRDNLETQRDILDWHGDHPHTNFHGMFDSLIGNGYYLEILGSPFTCFDALQYGALMLVDSEDVFYPEEVAKLSDDVANKGLGLIVFAEWYNAETAVTFKFFDDNTRSWWTPVTGGGNIPGLNALMNEFGIAFGDAVLKGMQQITRDVSVRCSSGANIVRFPAGGFLHAFTLEDTAAEDQSNSFYTLGLTQHKRGRVAVHGDSNCLDSSYQADSCYDLLKAMLEYVNSEKPSALTSALLNPDLKLLTSVDSEAPLPEPMDEATFKEASFVLSNPLQCYKNSPLEKTTGLERPQIEEQSEEEEHEKEERQEPGRNVTEATPTDRKQTIRPTTVKPTETGGSDASSNGGVPERPFPDVPQGFATWTPPMLLSKWSAVLGIVAMFGLYSVARRRRQRSSVPRARS